MNTETAIKQWSNNLARNRFPRDSVHLAYVVDQVIVEQYEIPESDDERAALAAELLALAVEHGPGVVQGVDERGDLLGNGRKIAAPDDWQAEPSHNARAREVSQDLAPYMQPGGVGIRTQADGLQGAAVVLGLASLVGEQGREHAARMERIDGYLIDRLREQEQTIDELQSAVVEQQERLAKAEAEVKAGEAQIWLNGFERIAPHLGPLLGGVGEVLTTAARGLGAVIGKQMGLLK